MNEMKKYIFGYEHMYYSVYGYDYEIYFVPAEAEETVVAVPKKDDYSVSGNNSDGFVVTVCRKADGETWQPTPAAVTEAAVIEQAVPETAAEEVVAAPDAAAAADAVTQAAAPLD